MRLHRRGTGLLRPRARTVRALCAGTLALAVGFGVSVAGSPATTAAAASATTAADGPITTQDACYTWGRTLRPGMTGDDVRQLQIRVAGWVSQDEVLIVDGEYGQATANAVGRFQAGYGLPADKIAGPQTFGKIYELQDDDCTPIHFTYPEFDKCNSNFTGSSRVTQAQAKWNILQVMWKMEALRRKLGDNPLRITSGFRNDRCNANAGGAANSPHLYGEAGDVGSGPRSLCEIYRAARSAGFSGLLGPGYPGHNDHIHADNRHQRGLAHFRRAPSC
jgi:zinc D-Ala-D-Ala carboxypeptidase